jgi:hypothetical protein
MKRIVLAGLLAACSKEPSDDYPIQPGGGGTSGTNRADAAVGHDGGSTTINGRVCLLLTNPHSLAMCATTGAAGLLVELGTATALTDDTGAFTLMRPAVTTGLVWRVAGTGVENAAIKFGTTTTLPVFDSNVYLDMLVSTNATIGAGTGALMMRATRGGFPITGATVAAQPLPDSEVYYDGPTELEWQQTATGAYGVAWIPSLGPANEMLTVTIGQTIAQLPPQPVFADTITFVLAEIP